MRGKLKTVTTCILILLTITLGTHITVQSTQTINNYLLPFGLVYALPLTQKNQNTIQGTSTNPGSLESFHTIATSINGIQDTINRALMKLELQKLQIPDPSDILNFADLNIESLTLDGIQAAKRSVENFTGRAFMKWQLQKMLSGEIKPFTSPPSNESAIRLFYQFLSEKPEYAEHFAQYDKLLSRENQLRIPERNLEMQNSFENIGLVVERGEILREWNSTQTIDGSKYFIMNREYAMEINGTTQKVVKVYIYSYDGREIVDPYMCIQWSPLLWLCYTWVFWWPYYIGWWPTVLLYGNDYYLYLSFTPDEQPWYKGWVYSNTLGSVDPTWYTAATVGFSFAGVAAYLCSQLGIATAVAAAASGVCTVGSFALAATYVVVHTYMLVVWNNFVNTETYNWFHDPTFGFKEVEYFHNPTCPPVTANPPCLDVQPYITPYYIRVDNWWYKLPWPYSLYISVGDAMWTSHMNFITVWASTFGLNTWVWIGPFPTDWPPPPPV